MRELRKYAEPALKITCLILAVFVVVELAGMVLRWNPFHGVTVPELPSLTASTNSPATGAHGTNLAASASVMGTNSRPHPAGTNLAPPVIIAKTNSISPAVAAAQETNVIAHTEPAMMGTNQPTNNVVARLETKLTGTNVATATNLGGNGTNLLFSTNAAGTNVALRPKPEMKAASAAPVPEMAGMNFNPFAPPGKRGADLPPVVQARISRIVDSEMLGPVMHPLPMALLGIAGEFAFIRSPGGQTGLVKEGDSLGELKLLRIGTNRVLVEQDGQKQELMIFSGYGGDSLLPTQKDTPDEHNHL